MNGPGHYRAAEEILKDTEEALAVLNGELVRPEIATQFQAAMTRNAHVAQVHATLALAAATAEKTVGSGKNYETWRLAIGHDDAAALDQNAVAAEVGE